MNSSIGQNLLIWIVSTKFSGAEKLFPMFLGL